MTGPATGTAPHISEIEDMAELEVSDKLGHPTYKSHWQLFVPTLVVCILYAIGMLVLNKIGMNETSLFRLFSIVLGVGVPLLAVHAFLRYQTVRLQFTKSSLRYHPGWPKDSQAEVPYELISNLKMKRGLAGLIFGGGTVIIELTTGNKISVADLKYSDEIMDEFKRVMQ